MWSYIVEIACEPNIVTTITLMEQAVREIWANLPAITIGLRAVGAALGVVAGIRAISRRRNGRP